MRELRIAALAATLLFVSLAGGAATPADFYVDLLQKGIGQYNAAEYAHAADLLRVAAFGLLDATDRYEIAQVYRAIAADKLSDVTTTRDATRRVLMAERIQRTYAMLALPAPVRTSFEAVAKKVLSPAEVAELRTAPAPAPVQTPPPPPATSTQQPVETKPAPQQQQPKPVEKKPEPKPVEKKPEPKPVEKKPVEKPPAKPTPAPAPVTPAPPRDLTSQFTAAERALATANLTEARRVYRQLLDATLTHEQALRVAEGLYRARDFSGVVRAFDRAGALRKGEEPYRFYLAVAYFETGRFAAAKKELDATLPYIEVTADVARYRDKIAAANK